MTDTRHSVTIESVTPKQAKEWLGTRIGKPIRTRGVEYLSRQILRGNWRTHGSAAISFDKNGVLVDGVQILQAIVKSNTAIDVPVFRDAAEDVWLVTNTGTPTNFSDVLKQKQVANANQQASVTRLAYDISLSDVNISGGPQVKRDNFELLTFYDAHPGILEAVREGERIYRSIGTSGTAMAVAFLMLDAVDSDQTREMFNRLAIGDMLTANTPYWALREYFLDMRDWDHKHRAPRQYASVIKAWNAYQLGRDERWRSASIQWNPLKEEWPTPEPVTS